MPTRDKKERRLAAQRNGSVTQESYVATHEIRLGPIPSSEEIEQYARLYPDSPRIFFQAYENQVNHRITLEKQVILGDNRRANIGQIFSFIIVMSVIATGTFLIYRDKDIVGIAAIIGALVALVSSFLSGSILRKNDRDNKR
jgi:hypothetical protein